MTEDLFHLGIKAIIRNPKGEILLLKINPKKNIITKDWKGQIYWDTPGGRIHKGDTVKDTLKREVAEETGIGNIKKITPFEIVLANIRVPAGDDTVGLILSSYLCDVGKTERIKISEEHTQAKWFSPKEASKLLEFKYPKEFVKKLSKLK